MKIKLIALITIFLFGTQKHFAQQMLNWAKGLEGTGSAGLSTISDAAGNIINGGQFNGTVDFDPGLGTFNLSSIGSGDMYITKLDVNGNLLWVKQMGGSAGLAGANSITKDASGNIYATGTYTGTVDFDPGPGVSNLSSNGAHDCFIAKYDPNGNYIWAKSIGGPISDVSYSIKVDVSSNVLITGFFQGTIDLNPGPGTNTFATVGFKDIFVLKLDLNGNFVWAAVAGSILDDSSYSLQTDASGNIYTTGYIGYNADFDPGIGVTTLSATAGSSAFIWKLNSSGNLVFAKALEGNGGSIYGQSIEIDNSGNILTTGFMNGPVDFDPDLNFVQSLPGIGANDIYVSKLNSLGDYVWASVMGGTAIEIGYSIEVDLDNNIYVTGNFQGTADFDPGASAYNLTSAGNNDIYISKLDPNGNFLCAGAMGSIGDDQGRCVHVDAFGNLHNTGYFTSVCDFDPGPSSFTLSTTGVNSTYFTKYTSLVAGTPLSYTICEGASTTLTGNGANTYSWSPAVGLSAASGLTVAASPTATTTYTVIGKGNCFNTSTLVTVNVKPKPSFIAPTSPQTVICIPDSIILSSSSSNTNTVFKYRFAISTTYTSPPFFAKTPGNYYAIATDTFVGCSDSSLIVVKNGKIPPNAYITSHTYINALSPIDTITCYQPTVNLVGASDTSGVVITWKSISNNSVHPNPAIITSLNNLKLIVKRNDNNCSDSSLVALVNQDNTLPTAIITSTTNAELNCSIYTTPLAAIFSPSNCTALWKTPSTSTITNPNTISTPGKYVVEVFNSNNGCLKKDSITIIQTNTIVLNTSNNFTVCKSSPATLTAQAIGTLSPVSYSWSNGATGNSVVVTNSITTNHLVTATSGSCIGTSTILVNIPSDIQDSIIAYRSCNDNTTGTILIFAKGGIQPYKYSINNGTTFSSSNSFTSIPFGTYNLVIKDSIGCLRQTSVSVSAGNNLPTPKFLASTKNSLGDTIVLVDISIPKPDSVQWVFPVNVTKIGGTMFSPVIVCSDTGNFSITMKGYYGNCIINTTKLVRFAPYDSLIANHTNANGIKTFSLYPNPNTGQFTVYIEFYRKQNASIQVWDISPYKHYQQNFYDVISITLPVDVSFLQNGSYLLRVIAEYDAKNKAFIINK
ncbi:MAG: SprB repeat-containing protein [Bacteroidia bacterium]|nr:SprB repeat-containing protein [Bacteroidia bacterium]